MQGPWLWAAYNRNYSQLIDPFPFPGSFQGSYVTPQLHWSMLGVERRLGVEGRLGVEWPGKPRWGMDWRPEAGLQQGFCPRRTRGLQRQGPWPAAL